MSECSEEKQQKMKIFKEATKSQKLFFGTKLD